MRPYDPVQPMAAVLDDEQLPEPVHPLAQAWRELDATEADALDAWRDAREKVPAAKQADRAAAIEAVEKGKPAPVPPNAHEQQAEANVHALAARLGEVRKEKREAGRVLLDALVEHRPEIEAGAAVSVGAAADAYAAALDKAQREVQQAAAALSAATAPLGLLGELDLEPRLRSEVGAHPWPVAAVDMTATRRDVKRIQAAAEHYSAARAPVAS